jgi:hypothetical protein
LGIVRVTYLFFSGSSSKHQRGRVSGAGQFIQFCKISSFSGNGCGAMDGRIKRRRTARGFGKLSSWAKKGYKD